MVQVEDAITSPGLRIVEARTWLPIVARGWYTLGVFLTRGRPEVGPWPKAAMITTSASW